MLDLNGQYKELLLKYNELKTVMYQRHPKMNSIVSLSDLKDESLFNDELSIFYKTNIAETSRDLDKQLTNLKIKYTESFIAQFEWLGKDIGINLDTGNHVRTLYEFRQAHRIEYFNDFEEIIDSINRKFTKPVNITPFWMKCTTIYIDGEQIPISTSDSSISYVKNMKKIVESSEYNNTISKDKLLDIAARIKAIPYDINISFNSKGNYFSNDNYMYVVLKNAEYELQMYEELYKFMKDKNEKQ